MTHYMERNKKIPLTLLLALLLVCAVRPDDGCKAQLKSLTCYNDYNRNITCVWDSTDVPDLTDNVCEIHAKRKGSLSSTSYNSSCKLEPIDVSRPALKSCSLIFNSNGTFHSSHVLSINLICNPVKQCWTMSYKPSSHIKLSPPEAPKVNFTSVSWIAQDPKKLSKRLSKLKNQMQWRQKDQPWSEVERTMEKSCKECEAELDSDLLIIGEEYEARVRVKSDKYTSVWSEWSPTVTWVSRVGKPKPPQSGDLWIVLGMTLAVAGSLLLTLVYFKTDKTAWVYIVDKVKPHVPDPSKSSLMKDKSWPSPHFTNKSLNSFLKPEEFATVEVANVDGFAPCRPDVALLEKMRTESSYDSTNSSFSNPSYSHLDPLPPVTSLTAGNLAPCPTDSPYGPVGGQGNGNTAEQDREVEESRKNEEILQLLTRRSSNSKPIPVIFDYNRVEKLQAERVRLQSLDSGMCSGEEVSQESLEADSINMTDSHDEVPQTKEEREGDNGQDEGFRKLFGNSSGGIVCKGSIQVCSGYEPVQKLQAESNELLSLDSGVSSGGEEQLSQEDSMEDIDKSTESTRFPFPPASCALPCMLPFSTSLPFRFSGPSFIPAQQPLPCHLLERIALMSTSKSVEPSGDGYMPVAQKQS